MDKLKTVKKKTGPTKNTPENWKKSGVYLCPKQNQKCKNLVLKGKELNRDLIINKALSLYFKTKS